MSIATGSIHVGVNASWVCMSVFAAVQRLRLAARARVRQKTKNRYVVGFISQQILVISDCLKHLRYYSIMNIDLTC